jgi:Secretion system C-terminal sorting domain/FG-GAP repeat/FG-GAP-like repeat
MPSALFAQNEWPLKPWVEVVGSESLKQLGLSVSYLGQYGDSTRIGVSDVDGIRVYQMKSPTDTVPKYFIKAGVSFVGEGAISALGDFNGDGIKDLVVATADSVCIYLGKAGGNFDTTPFWTKHSDARGDEFALAVGRINGDAYDDLVISSGDVNGFVGEVHAYFGGPSMDTLADFAVQGDGNSSSFGINVAVGDLNNDGFDDIIVRGYDSKSQIESQRFGYIKVYLGGNTIDTVAWAYLKGGDSYGPGLACFDVNGDGIKDLLWANTDSALCVYVHYGGSHIDSIPNMRLNNPGIASFGLVIANAGDMNGDGYDDVAVSAYDATPDAGFVFIFSGGPNMDGNYDAAGGIGGNSFFGYSVVGIGDVNGDGLSDILVGAPQYQFNENRGYWAILLGDKNIPVTGVKKENASSPKVFELYQNYPNPFNPTTTISFSLPKSSFTTLKIYDLLGREITTLINAELMAGHYSKTWQANSFSSGVYFYSLRSGGFVETKKLLLQK